MVFYAQLLRKCIVIKHEYFFPKKNLTLFKITEKCFRGYPCEKSYKNQEIAKTVERILSNVLGIGIWHKEIFE